MTASAPVAERPRTRAWLAQVLGGGAGSLVSIAVVLTLGVLAFAPLGLAAAEVGIPAAFLSATVGGFVVAAIAGSRLPTAGPTSATALILAGLVATLAADTQIQVTQPAGIATVLALTGAAIGLMGALQIAFGVLRLGSLVKFVPQPALAGFMNGVAVVILINQVPPLLGLTRADLAQHGVGAFAAAQPATLAVGLLSAVVVWLVPRWVPRAPASLTGLAVGTAVFFGLQWAFPDLSLGAQAGAVAQRIPWPTAWMPLLDAAPPLLARHLADVAVTGVVLAVIGSLETVLSVSAVDQAIGSQSEPNRELVALGIANVACGAIGGVPLAYLRARAIATYKAGGDSRLAAVAGCVALGLLYFVGAPLMQHLPLTVLAGLMVTVAVALSDAWTRQMIDHWRRGDHTSEVKRSLAIVAAVCVVTLWLGFPAGVLLGVVLATAGFLRTMNRSLLAARYTGAQRGSRRIYPAALEAVLTARRQSVVVLELEGALFFGNVERLGVEIDGLRPRPSHLILDFAQVTTVDATGAVKLGQLSRALAAEGIALILASVREDNRLGATLLAHHTPGSTRDWADDVDRALERAELDLLAAAGQPLEHRPLALARCDLLRGLDADDVERVGGAMHVRRLAAGERLFSQGDPGDALYVLTEGSISIVQRDAAGRVAQRFLSFSPGMTFGEVALLDGSGRTADAIADTDAVVHALSKAGLESLERTAPHAVIHLYRNLATHLSTRLRSATAVTRPR